MFGSVWRVRVLVPVDGQAPTLAVKVVARGANKALDTVVEQEGLLAMSVGNHVC